MPIRNNVTRLLYARRELNLKALAASLGEKKLRMATQREAEELTGRQVGGISALALLNLCYRYDSACNVNSRA